MNKRLVPVLVLTAFALILPQLLGCSSNPSTKNKKSTLREVTPVTVFYARMYDEDEGELVGEEHIVPKTSDMPRAALQELITGKPNTTKAFRVLPAETRILGMDIKEGVATVNFNKEVLNVRSTNANAETIGIASIVATLTQFSEIKQVRFLVEGRDKGEIDGKNIEDWWGFGGIKKQPFKM